MASNYFPKDPAAVLDYEFDWSTWLTEGETIASHVVTVSGVNLDSTTASTTSVVAWVSAGTAGTKATVACKITTTASRIDERTITLGVTDR